MIRIERPRFWRIVAAIALLGILLATLTPIPGAAERSALTPLVCLVCGEIGAVDVLNNLLLFLPLGFTLRMAGMRRGLVVTVAALLTLSVESAQYFIVAGRDASLSDVITNTLGGAAGVVLADSLAILLAPGGRALTLLLIASNALPPGILAASAWLLQPAPPRSLWYGQLAPDLGQYERFRGRILSASLGGTRLPSGPLRVAENPAFELGATFVTGEPPSDLAPIVSVFDQHQRKVILLGQSGTDLHFEARIRGENLHFRPLALSLAHALPARPGDTLSAAGRYDGRTLHLEVSQPGATRQRELDVSAALGWALVAPWYGPMGSQARTITMLWLALLWAPLGFYWEIATRKTKPATRRTILVALPIATAAITTAFTLLAGFPLNHWSEWVGAALGAILGYGWKRRIDLDQSAQSVSSA